MSKKKLEVCLSPSLLHLYDFKESAVVIIDIFRATTTMVSAMYHGANSIIPVAEVEECIRVGEATPNSITAGERDGWIAPGLQYGNSPSLYAGDFVKDKNLVLTTTNGTRLLFMVKDASKILVGAFPNLSAIVAELKKLDMPVLLACASWKDRVNMEDSLFAGAVAHHLSEDFDIHCDSALITMGMYREAEKDIYEYLRHSNHFKRLSDRKYQEDIRYATTVNQNPIVCYYEDGKIIAND